MAGTLDRDRGLRGHRGRVEAAVLLPRDVRVPVGPGPRRTRPQLHDWRRRRPPEAHAGRQRPASVRMGCVRHAGRERRHQEQPAPGAVDARQHRAHEGAVAAPRHQLRVGPRTGHVPARLLPLEPVAVHPHVRARPGVSPALDRQLVPELPDRARQRAGDRRRVLALRHAGHVARTRAVVPAHHALRRGTARGHQPPARLAREGPDDAAELDREVGGRAGHVPDCRRRGPRHVQRHRDLHDPHRHDLRCDVRADRARARTGGDVCQRVRRSGQLPQAGRAVPAAGSPRPHVG